MRRAFLDAEGLMHDARRLRRRGPDGRRRLTIAAWTLLGALGAGTAGLAAQSGTAHADPGLARLQREVTDLTKISKGTVGVAIVHLETGRTVLVNGNESFPMASTFKLPVAVQLLTRVDRGELRLDSLIALQPGDLHPGSGTLTQLFNQPGVELSVRNLMDLMLRISDNSAADLMLRTAGGPTAVNARLHALGVNGIEVDRPTVRLIADYIGIPNLPSDSVTPAEFRELARAVSDSASQAAATAFERDPRDQATPAGMADLLAKVWHGAALSPASTQLLLDVMHQCLTSGERIRAMLPPGTPVADKTGTLGGGDRIHGVGTQNDVGIIDLPDSAGHVITVVLVKGEDHEKRGEETIAQIARAAYDYFRMNPEGSFGGPPAAARR